MRVLQRPMVRKNPVGTPPGFKNLLPYCVLVCSNFLCTSLRHQYQQTSDWFLCCHSKAFTNNNGIFHQPNYDRAVVWYPHFVPCTTVILGHHVSIKITYRLSLYFYPTPVVNVRPCGFRFTGIEIQHPSVLDVEIGVAEFLFLCSNSKISNCLYVINLHLL